MPAKNLIEDNEIQFGWVRGDHVVFGDYTEGEDSHHVTQQNDKLDGESSEDWKRWRYARRAVFWWEAPTRQEKTAVENELPAVDKHVFVELRSTRRETDRAKAARLMPTVSLAKLGDENPMLAAEILDVTHYPDARSDYFDRWLASVGD